MLAELREGWTEFRKHTWLWATVIQYCLVMMAWNGAFFVLGPVVARAHLGGAAAWGAISAAEALGLIVGGVISLRYTPRRPMLLVVSTGGLFALSPLMLGLVAPLAVVCVTAFGLGAIGEVMMVQWTVAMATRIPSDKLARVSSYDAFGSLAAMPLGALVAGPLAAGIGVSATEFAAAAVIFTASAFTLIPRDIWTIRSDDAASDATALAEAVTAAAAGPLEVELESR
jgi:predicted MFS family arabinose efflux permease